MRIPISTKLIVMTVGLLVATTVGIGLSNSKEIEKRVSTREKEFNKDKAKAKGLEIQNILSASIERTQALGQSMNKKGNVSDDADTNFNFEKDQNLVAISIYKVNNGVFEPIAFKAKESFLKANNIDTSFFTKLRQQLPFPLKSVAQKQIEIRNSTLPKSPPLFTIGIPLAKDENDAVTSIALADFKLGLIEKVFNERTERVLFLTDKNGSLLAHKDEEKALARLSFNTNPMVQMAMASSDDTQNLQKEYEDPETEQRVIGDFYKVPGYNVFVFVQVNRSIIQEAVDQLLSSIIKTAGVSVSVAIFLIFLFSMTLTSPIEKLAEMIQLVSKGNFDVKARSKIKSHDEVGDLATAFDNMTEGLKERDKVKNLFNKFHGSSITEDLLKNDIGVGGQNKEVTVFFSDIRGFTSFSEKRTPEEVVEMLNEYFEVMVGIINKYNGVVDKFIGDAIMAVWGAPTTGDRDTHNALRACMEMRKSLEDLNKKREARNQPPIMIGMGLHTGRAISGTIGSSERMEYTVIGNTVNTTSRIEASTKAFGSDLLVSEDVVAKVGEEFQVELAGAAEVKGRSEPLKMFKVRAYKENGQFIEVRTPFSDYEAEKVDKVKVAS